MGRNPVKDGILYVAFNNPYINALQRAIILLNHVTGGSIFSSVKLSMHCTR